MAATRNKLAIFSALAMLVGGAVATPTFAQSGGAGGSTPIDPERLLLAREYLRESHLADSMKGMMGNMIKAMPVPGGDDPRGRQLLLSMSAGLDAVLPDLLEATVRTTASVFTTQELKDLVAFYATPSGQAMMAKMPLMMRQVLPMMSTIGPKMYTFAEADYCAHITCTVNDHALFAKMREAMTPRAQLAPGA